MLNEPGQMARGAGLRSRHWFHLIKGRKGAKSITLGFGLHQVISVSA
jgi:hypothetical protein